MTPAFASLSTGPKSHGWPIHAQHLAHERETLKARLPVAFKTHQKSVISTGVRVLCGRSGETPVLALAVARPPSPTTTQVPRGFSLGFHTAPKREGALAPEAA
jgi:hypothetical protein